MRLSSRLKSEEHWVEGEALSELPCFGVARMEPGPPV